MINTLANKEFCKQNKIKIFIPVGNNRLNETLDLQTKVFDKFGFEFQYSMFPFPFVSHGESLNWILENHSQETDYVIFMENDSFPMREDFIRIVFDKIKDNQTIFGQAQQSNHITVNGTVQHVYAGPGCLAFSKQLWKDLGKPSLNHNYRSDAGEELTWLAKEKGYNICLVYPSSVLVKNCPLDNGLSFGLGNVFGQNLFYHAMQQNDPESIKDFKLQLEKLLKSNI